MKIMLVVVNFGRNKKKIFFYSLTYSLRLKFKNKILRFLYTLYGYGNISLEIVTMQAVIATIITAIIRITWKKRKEKLVSIYISKQKT